MPKEAKTLMLYLTIRASLAPCDALFPLKGPKVLSVQPATHNFYSRARWALSCDRKSWPIGRPFFKFNKKMY